MDALAVILFPGVPIGGPFRAGVKSVGVGS